MSEREAVSITAADVGTISAEDLVGKQPPPPEHIICCTRCRRPHDKGQPAHPSDVQHFVCDLCQVDINRKAFEAAAPTVVIKP